jgi:hypothetical protein
VLVAKSFLISQVSFYLGIIPLDINAGKAIEEMIEKYAIGKLQIAKDRIYNKVEQGGTGLLKITELDTAMKSAWVNRWKREGNMVDITGTRVLSTALQEKIEYINKDFIATDRHPCARGIANAWHIFREKLYENDGNLFNAGLFSNPGIRNRMGEMLGGGNIFSRIRYEGIRDSLWEIPLGVFCLEDGIREKGEVQNIIGFDITNVEYNKLKNSIKYIRNKFKPNWELMGKGKNIAEWLAPIKKGSNKIRNLMSGRGSRQYRNFSFDKIRPIASLWQKMGLEMQEGLITCGMLVWTTNEVDTEFRQFAFRWNQGMIHGNTVISHFGDVDRKCTFCKILAERALAENLGRELTPAERDGINVVDEDRPHIFWECPTVYNCIRDVHFAYWGGRLVEKQEFLMGKELGTVEATVLYMLSNMYIKYKIWKYKLAGALPRVHNISNDLKEWMNNLLKYNKWRIMLPLVRQQLQR